MADWMLGTTAKHTNGPQAVGCCECAQEVQHHAPHIQADAHFATAQDTETLQFTTKVAKGGSVSHKQKREALGTNEPDEYQVDVVNSAEHLASRGLNMTTVLSPASAVMRLAAATPAGEHAQNLCGMSPQMHCLAGS